MNKVDQMMFEKGPGFQPTGPSSTDSHRGFQTVTPITESEKDCGYRIGVEIFYCPTDYRLTTEDGLALAPGWYWWPCLAGCLPDVEPLGPFTTSKAAYEDAQKEYAG